jgi:hypothetical protein
VADNTYIAQAGFVQFDPQEREANGKDVVDFTIKCIGKPINLRVTLWPELKAGFGVKKGDFVAVEGKFTQSTWQDDEGTKRTSNQLSAYNLHINGQKIEREETERVEGGEATSTDDSDLPF